MKERIYTDVNARLRSYLLLAVLVVLSAGACGARDSAYRISSPDEDIGARVWVDEEGQVQEAFPGGSLRSTSTLPWSTPWTVRR